MNAHKKTLLTLAVLVTVALVFSTYTACAQLVASRVHEINGTLQWPTPGYAFLPWPKMATGIVLQVTVPLNQADLQYYHYVIQSGILVVLALVMWLLVAATVWRLKKSKTSKKLQ